jgi:Raf kinase inhibitor-like YbhB/YbcL family protein
VSRRTLAWAVVVALVCVVVGATVTVPAGAASKPKFTLTSSAFTNNAAIPVEYSCRGGGTQPPLAWSHVPKGTKQLALIMEDPDAPSGTFVHWVVAGIKPKPPSIAADSTPTGAVVGDSSIGRPGWVPPCPPSGEHHYIFTLSALDEKITLPPGGDAATLRSLMKGKVVGRAKLTGLFAAATS